MFLNEGVIHKPNGTSDGTKPNMYSAVFWVRFVSTYVFIVHYPPALPLRTEALLTPTDFHVWLDTNTRSGSMLPTATVLSHE